MFRSRDNQSIAGTTTPASSSHESTSTYPPLDEKHKKESLRNKDENNNDMVFQDEPASEEDQRLIKKLSEQAYHLPGYEYWDDWKQYITNNHPMFGICFHHPLHPIGWGMRALCFLASIVFGLVITNIVWLWAQGLEDNSAVFTVDMGQQAQRGTNVTQYLIDINENNQLEVTTDMVVLWTFGGALHGFFDNTIWTLTICSFCDPGGRYEHLAKYKRFGVGLLSFAVLAIAGIATLSVVLRAALENSDEEVQFNELRSAGLMDDAVDFKGQNKESYEFLLSYCVELAIALLFHFPVIGFILFSGCLNIKGKLPIFGGRPYEVLCEEEELAGINGDVDPETGEPIQPTGVSMFNKDRSTLLNSSNIKEDGKVSGMAKFWNKKVQSKSDDSAGAKSSGTPVRAPRNAAFPRPNNQPASPPSSHRGSTGTNQGASTFSPGVQPGRQTYRPFPNQQRRGSAGYTVPPQQRRGSASSTIPPNQRRGSTGSNNHSSGARGYSGGRIYIPQQQGRGGPGRGNPGRGAFSPQPASPRRSQGTTLTARIPASPGRSKRPAASFPHYSAK
mmetsp:Transcript_17201/g.32638  ORF Transcript_17201/g.32638 Transcript_17201/m.32638 type:complete len:560 (-) Transcript_17201:160-1839(-)